MNDCELKRLNTNVILQLPITAETVLESFLQDRLEKALQNLYYMDRIV